MCGTIPPPTHTSSWGGVKLSTWATLPYLYLLMALYRPFEDGNS